MRLGNSYIFGFDVETYRDANSEHQFFSFQVYGVVDGNVISKIFYSIYDFKNLFKILNLKRWNKNKKQKIILVGFNSEFDVSVLIKELDKKNIKYDVKLRYNKSSFLKASFYFSNKKKPDIQVIDLKNFNGSNSLGQLAKKFGLEKLEFKNLGCLKAYQKNKKQFEQYAINDAKITYLIFKQIIQTAQKYNKLKQIPLSAPSLSYNLFVSKNSLPRYDNKFDFICNQLLKGGRTEVFIRGCVDSNNFGKIYSYDFNSLYPFVMYRYEFPNTEKLVKKSLDFDYEGFAICKVKIFDNYIGAIGVHSIIDGYKKLVFPTGNIRGVFSFAELKFIEDYGLGKIEKVISAYAFDRIQSPFKQFIEFWYNIKKQNNEMRQVAKLILNSLYGRLCTRLYNINVRKFDTNNITPNELVGCIVDWDNSPNLLRKIQESDRFVGSNPIIGAYITALARLELTKLLIDLKDRNKEIFYCDTDSVFTNAKINTSNELGALKLEGVYSKCIFIKSKSYITFNENDKVTYKLKGVPKQFEFSTPKNAINFDILKFKHIVSIRESLAQNKTLLSETERKYFLIYESDGKRKYHKNLDSKEKIFNDWTDSEPLRF